MTVCDIACAGAMLQAAVIPKEVISLAAAAAIFGDCHNTGGQNNERP